jgi:RNA-binding protein
MEKLVHSISLNVFERQAENLPSIYEVFHRFLPLDFEKNRIVIDHQQLEGFSDIIHSLTLQTTANRHNLLVLETLFTNLTKNDINLLDQQKESRLNDDGVFYIRLDKSLLLQSIFQLTDSGDCFHIKIKLAAYPATRERYVQNLQNLIDQFDRT